MNKLSVSFKSVNWLKQKSTKCVILVLVAIVYEFRFTPQV